MKLTKLDILKTYGDVQQSKTGSNYVVLSTVLVKKEIIKSWANVTKNTILEAKDRSYNKTNKEMLLLKNNKFYYKQQMEDFFRVLSISKVKMNNNLARAYFFNKKCEFLKNENPSYYTAYNFLKSFSSMKEVKNYLGFTFLSVENFKSYSFESIINLYMRFKSATIVYRFLKNSSTDWVSYLADINNMANGTAVIPESPGACVALHDKLVLEQNLVLLSNKSEVIVTFPHNFDNIDSFEKKIRLTSEKDLFKEGLEMSHCVRFRSHLLSSNAFYSIVFENNRYTLQINKNGDLVEIQGYKNRTNIPEKLKQIIRLN